MHLPHWTECDKYDYLVDGPAPWTRRSLQYCRAGTCAELLDACARMQVWPHHNGEHYPGPNPKDGPENQPEPASSKGSNNPRIFCATKKSRHTLSEEELTCMRKVGLCFHCGKRRHISAKCPAKQTKDKPSTQVHCNTMAALELSKFKPGQDLLVVRGRLEGSEVPDRHRLTCECCRSSLDPETQFEDHICTKGTDCIS